MNPTDNQHVLLPASPLQQGMVFHDLAAPGSGCDVEQVVVRIKGHLPDLKPGFAAATARHDALRLCVRPTAGEPSLGIAETVDIPWQTAKGTEIAFEEWLASDRFTPFCLETPPLQRICVWEVSPQEHLLVWTFHHLLLDGRSIATVLHEVFSGKPAQIGAVAPYLNWLAGKNHTASSAFWKQHLAGFVPTPLQINQLGPLSTNPGQNQCTRYLSHEGTQQLTAFLPKHPGLTANTLVLAAWFLVLSRYSGQSSVTTGTTRACRHVDFDGIANVIGLAINTVPMKAEVEAETSCLDFLHSLRKTWLELREHELTPLPEIRRHAGLTGNTTLFEHLVVYDHQDLDTAIHRLEPTWTQFSFELRELTTVPLTLQVYGGEQLKLQCAYNTAQFSQPLIAALLSHVEQALLGFTVAKSLGEISLLTPLETATLTYQKPSPATAPECLHTWFSEQARKTPNAQAVSAEDTSLTYAELDAQSSQLAHYLISLAVQPGELVGLRAERNSLLVVGILGILKAGAAYLPMDLSYPADRIRFMMEDSQARILLTPERLAEELPELSAKIIAIDDVPAYASFPPTSPTVEVSANPPAYCIFTSGSTGKPKGCLISHQNVVRLMRQTEAWFGFDENDVWTLFHSSAFDFSVWEIWGALLYGGRLVVVPFDISRSPEEFRQLLAKEQVTVLNQTPSAFRQLIAADEIAKTELHLRYVVFGGEALEMRSLEPWFNRHGDKKPQLVNMYGITETTVHVTYRPLTKDDVTKGSVIGCPIPDLQLFVLDPQLRPCPQGVPGEMFVAGEGLAIGYLNRPELTDIRFIPHPFQAGKKLYRTGDLARWLPDGELEYLGRIDQQVKIRGFRIELGEIVSVLLTHPAIREACVYPREENGSRKLIAWMVPSGNPPSDKELRQHLKSALPDYMIPADFVVMERIPMTTNGKLDSNALPMPKRAVAAGGSLQKPRNAVESTLAEIWCKVLRRPSMGINENFFEIGGDSILGIHLISAARKAGLQFTPKLLFAHPTIEELAKAAIAEQAPVLVSETSVDRVKPLPIHGWFFEQKLANPHHYNQAFCFELKLHVEPAVLEKALRKVIAHHQALRLRTNRIVGPSDSDLAFSTSTQPPNLLSIQQAVNFEHGPIVAANYYTKEAKNYLLLVIQHLAVDAVSWGILLEDLELALGSPEAALPPVPTPYAIACEHLQSMGREYWESKTFSANVLPIDQQLGENTEATVEVVSTKLSVEQTEILLRKAPALFHARTHELLVAALLLAIQCVTEENQISINLEGHGREDIFAGADLSRTLGWFTSIYPISISLPRNATPSQAVRLVKEHLVNIPANGASFGASNVKPNVLPDLLFNYLGQLDQLTAHSRYFAASKQPVGPTHASENRRRYHHEIESHIADGQFQLDWRFSTAIHHKETIQAVVKAFYACLAGLLETTNAAEARTASDFPLAGLSETELSKIVEQYPRVQDIYPLSPMQQLFLSTANHKATGGYDRWQATIHGPLDKERLKSAWEQVALKHDLLRVNFWIDGSQPLHCIQPTSTTTWSAKDDIGLTSVAISKIEIHSISTTEHRFTWHAPELLLDGWSWPLLFADLGRAYQHLPHVASATGYGEYIHWLGAQSPEKTNHFWTTHLGDFEKPTPLPVEIKVKSKGTISYQKYSQSLDAATSACITSTAAQYSTTAGAIIHTTWALLMSNAEHEDVVIGTAVSGRPSDLPNVEHILGPFTNNLPVRVRLGKLEPVHELWRKVRAQLMDLQSVQHSHPTQIQDASKVPWKDRLFNSLVVFQNYTVDDAVGQWGKEIRLSDFDGPLHSNYPIMLVVTPQTPWKIELLVPEGPENESAASTILAAFQAILQSTLATPEQAPTVQALQTPAIVVTIKRTNLVPARTPMERQLFAIWQRAFGTSEISVDDNFFDIGGHSLLMLRVHSELTKSLPTPLPLVKLFQYPSISTLAQFLAPTPKNATVTTAAANARNRVAAARAALSRIR